MPSATPAKIRIAVIGFGNATSSVMKPLVEQGGFDLVACADPHPGSRQKFQERFGGKTFPGAEELLDGTELDAVYIATPTRLHEELALAAFARGLHVLVEKPIALDLTAASRMIAAAEAAGRVLMVNHKRSADRDILTLRWLLQSGHVGRVSSINRWHFSDWFYRPRAAEERDPAFGGVVLRQGAHEFDIMLGLMQSPPVRMTAWIGSSVDPERAGEGAYHAVVECADGTIATSLYSGFDRFRSDELTIGPLPPHVIGGSQRALARKAGSPEAEYEIKRNNGRERPPELLAGMYGFTLVSCTGADLRPAPGGKAWVYDSGGRHEASIDGSAGTRLIVDELHRAITTGLPPVHGGAWGLACLELCVAVREAAATHSPVTLQHQMVPATDAASTSMWGEHELHVEDAHLDAPSASTFLPAGPY